MAGSVNEPAGEWLDNKWVSEGNTTKTGGEGSICPTPRMGGGALWFPRRPARPLSPLFYDSTQSRLPDGNLRCIIQTVCVDVWGEWNQTTPVQGGEQAGVRELATNGDAILGRPASPHQSASQLSRTDHRGNEAPC